MRLDHKLGCKGYWGFGGGWELAENGPGVSESYCSRQCPISAQCWQDHRVRCQSLFPDLCKIFELMVEYHGSAVAIDIWFKEMKCADPYTAILSGNMTDGAHCRVFNKPVNRNRATIPWPFIKQ